MYLRLQIYQNMLNIFMVKIVMLDDCCLLFVLFQPETAVSLKFPINFWGDVWCGRYCTRALWLLLWRWCRQIERPRFMDPGGSGGRCENLRDEVWGCVGYHEELKGYHERSFKGVIETGVKVLSMINHWVPGLWAMHICKMSMFDLNLTDIKWHCRKNKSWISFENKTCFFSWTPWDLSFYLFHICFHNFSLWFPEHWKPGAPKAENKWKVQYFCGTGTEQCTVPG